MPAMNPRTVFRAALALASALLLAVPATAQVSEAPSPVESEEEAFVRILEAAPPDAAVDRKRLSRLFFGVAATLEGGKTAVRLLQSAPSARLLSTEAARGLSAARFQAYAEAVERFRGEAARLLDAPDSGAALYRVMVAGHRACWRLDEYTRLMQQYGVRGPDLTSVLSSTEACARFRRAAFQDCVEGLVSRDLAGTDALREELRDAAFELQELERLLDDLRRIDAAD